MEQKKAAEEEQDAFAQSQKESFIARQKGTIVGTEDYIAPEVLAEEPSGPPADLWSFGVIVYMMLCG